MIKLIKNLRSKALWIAQIHFLKTQVSLGKSAFGREVPFLLFILGIFFIFLGIREVFIPASWIFLGGVLVYLGYGKEVNDSRNIVEKDEIEDLKKIYSRRAGEKG